MRRDLVLRVAALLLLAPAGRAVAAGGAHAVDDAGVETPGACHLESWVSRKGKPERLLNFGPACTDPALPNVEIGATIQRLRSPGRANWLIGPAIKWAVRDGAGAPGERAGVALLGTVLVDTRSGRVEGASLVVPVSLAVTGRLAVNLNAGAQARTRVADQLLYGGQAIWQARDGLELMEEVFGAAGARPGVQAGVRRTFDRGRMDIDLLAARPPGRAGAAMLTLGFTVRR